MRRAAVKATPEDWSLRREYDDLVAAWGIRPKLAELLDRGDG